MNDDLLIVDEQFRIANYLSCAQLYLKDNPLLKRKLGMSDIKKKSWYLESINDSFDSSYCDIYAKIASINYTGVDKEII